MPFPILIIDDEVSLRQVTAQYISLEGFEVLEAGTLKDARQQLQRQSFSVVLCDVKLPDGNGVDLIKEINLEYKEQFNNRIRLLLSGLGFTTLVIVFAVFTYYYKFYLSSQNPIYHHLK